MSRTAVTRSYFHFTVLRAGLDTLESDRDGEGKEAFIQHCSDGPFDNAAPSVEKILHAMSKQRELLQVLPFTGLRSC